MFSCPDRTLRSICTTCRKAYKHKACLIIIAVPPATFLSASSVNTEYGKHLFVLLLACTLGLGRTTEGLLSVLALLALLSAGLLDLGGDSDSNQSVVGLELLQGLWRIVYESETGCLSTTILSAETEDVDLILAGLVQLGEFATELFLGDVCAVWVEDINDHLLSAQERVADEFARAQSYWLVGHLVGFGIDRESAFD